MNNEQTQAMEELIEWRDAIHERVKSGVDREHGDLGLWFALIGICAVMNKVTTAFGLDSDNETTKVSA